MKLGVHFYAPGPRLGDALASCTDCGMAPTDPRFARRHEPSRYNRTPEWVRRARERRLPAKDYA